MSREPQDSGLPPSPADCAQSNSFWIKRLDVRAYGCIIDASFNLTPLHALIGPNDSGKSTALRALRAVARLAADGDLGQFQTAVNGSGGGQATRIAASLQDEREITGTCGMTIESLAHVAERPCIPRLLRLDADALRTPGPSRARAGPMTFLDDRGTGLPDLIEALCRDPHKRANLENEVWRLFPRTGWAGLCDANAGGRLLLPASALGEGLLYYLAFWAAQYVEPTNLLLVEHPENGLHPSRIADAMRILRDISKTTQVVIATHSPLVVNELSGDEVSVVWRTRDKGTTARLLSDTFNYDERSKIYSNGELWLAHCDGESEHDLLNSPEQAT